MEAVCLRVCVVCEKRSKNVTARTIFDDGRYSHKDEFLGNRLRFQRRRESWHVPELVQRLLRDAALRLLVPMRRLRRARTAAHTA